MNARDRQKLSQISRPTYLALFYILLTGAFLAYRPSLIGGLLFGAALGSAVVIARSALESAFLYGRLTAAQRIGAILEEHTDNVRLRING